MNWVCGFVEYVCRQTGLNALPYTYVLRESGGWMTVVKWDAHSLLFIGRDVHSLWYVNVAFYLRPSVSVCTCRCGNLSITPNQREMDRGSDSQSCHSVWTFCTAFLATSSDQYVCTYGILATFCIVSYMQHGAYTAAVCEVCCRRTWRDSGKIWR